jgi:hypothetical protein
MLLVGELQCVYYDTSLEILLVLVWSTDRVLPAIAGTGATLLCGTVADVGKVEQVLGTRDRARGALSAFIEPALR